MLNLDDKVSLFKNKVINKLLRGDDSVYSFFIESVSKHTNIYYDIVQLNVRYNTIKTNFNKNILETKEYNIEVSKINNSLLELLKKVNKDNLNNLKNGYEISSLTEALQTIESLIIERNEQKEKITDLEISLRNKELSMHEKFVNLESSMREIKDKYKHDIVIKKNHIRELTSELQKYKYLSNESEVSKANLSLQNKINGLELRNELLVEKSEKIIEELENDLERAIKSPGIFSCTKCEGKKFIGVDGLVVIGIKCIWCKGTGHYIPPKIDKLS